MESYGLILKRKRAEKQLTLDAVERETTITKQYIEALEEEMIDVFPGEPYFIGFLNNYCEFLGVDSKEILRLYNAKKIQEAPVPQELLQPHKSKLVLPLTIISCAALLLGVGIYLYFFLFNVPEKNRQRALSSVEKTKIHQYKFEGKPETRRLYKGDQILFPTVEGDGNIFLTVSGTLGKLSLLAPSGNQIVELSEERDIDVDGDGMADIIVYLSDVSDSDESHGAEVRILEKMETEIIELPDSSDQAVAENSVDSSKNTGIRSVIHESNRAYPFSFDASIRAACLVRYRIDRQDFIEDYLKSGDRITVSANNGIRLWTSNINAMKIQVKAGLQTYDLEVGKAGEVKAEDIKWVRDSDGKFRLVVIELD